MTFDGFDAAVQIQSAQAPLLLLPTEAGEGPTLQDALTANRDALAPDLWHSRPGDHDVAAFLVLHARGLPTDPSSPDAAGGTSLRPLKPEEKLLLAGGNGSEITVTGPGYWDPTLPNDPDPGYLGGGGGSGPGDPEPEANPTPCVETSPAGVSLQAMNNAALAASNAIAALDDEHFEYGSIIWSLNGIVSWTTPYTQNSDHDVNWLGGLSEVPAGAVIVGIVHNHPDISNFVDDRIPSGNLNPGFDWPHYNQLVDQDHPPNFGRGITADPNALLYIYTNQDHKTHVYDNTDKNQDGPSCALQP